MDKSRRQKLTDSDKGGEASHGYVEGVEDEKPVRKNHYLYQSKINMAKKILGVGTETEALDAALDLLIYGEALAVGTEEMADEEYIDILGIGEELPSGHGRGV